MEPIGKTAPPIAKRSRSEDDGTGRRVGTDREDDGTGPRDHEGRPAMPMRQEDLETFVAVAESGTIAAAAEHLFITQSTASERIRSLEADIGHKLVERRRGVRKVALTPAGERLVPIASAILSLYDEAARVDMRPRRQRLIVAAADSLNGHLLIPFYRAFIADHPDILLELRTSMSPVINREVEERVADVGLAFSLERYPDLAARELFRDRWVILCHRDSAFARSGRAADLAGEHEINTHYSPDYQTWHRHYFARFAHPKITVGTASQLGAFMDAPESWCIAPQSIARPLTERHPELVMRHPTEEPPARVARILVHTSLGDDKGRLVSMFESELRAYIATLDL